MDMSKYREMFLSEAGEHLQNMNRLAIALEKNPRDQEGIDALFREAHSIKGMAASMGYDRTAELAHHLEDLMDGFRKSGEVTAAGVDRLLAGIDLLEGLLQDLSADQGEREISHFLSVAEEGPSPAAETGTGQKEPVPASADRELLVSVELAEDAPALAARALLVCRELESLGSLLASSPSKKDLTRGVSDPQIEIRLQTEVAQEEIKAKLAAIADVRKVQIASAQQQASVVGHSRREDSARTVRVKTDLLDRLINLIGEMVTCRNILQSTSQEERWPQVVEGLDHLARLVTDLHHQILQVRMTPLESITGRLSRLVRELSRKTGKELRLVLEGEDIEMDRAILEALADPLVHMVRNAVDHGIEQSGRVFVKAWREKDLVLLEIADDGRGIDVAAIRKKALNQNLITPAQARNLPDRDILQLICLPGFSTTEEVTETSGRGVGMDVVKTAIETLGGSIEIASAPGEGSRFLLKLPVSVAIIKALVVENAGVLCGIPVTRVHRSLGIERHEVSSSGRQLAIQLDDEVVPLLSMRKILSLPKKENPKSLTVVITEARGRRVGLVVDRLAGQREIFVQALKFPINRIAGLAGASVLGDGQVVFLIDPQSLLDRPVTSPATQSKSGE